MNVKQQILAFCVKDEIFEFDNEKNEEQIKKISKDKVKPKPKYKTKIEKANYDPFEVVLIDAQVQQVNAMDVDSKIDDTFWPKEDDMDWIREAQAMNTGHSSTLLHQKWVQQVFAIEDEYDPMNHCTAPVWNPIIDKNAVNYGIQQGNAFFIKWLKVFKKIAPALVPTGDSSKSMTNHLFKKKGKKEEPFTLKGHDMLKRLCTILPKQYTEEERSKALRIICLLCFKKHTLQWTTKSVHKDQYKAMMKSVSEKKSRYFKQSNLFDDLNIECLNNLLVMDKKKTSQFNIHKMSTFKRILLNNEKFKGSRQKKTMNLIRTVLMIQGLLDRWGLRLTEYDIDYKIEFVSNPMYKEMFEKFHFEKYNESVGKRQPCEANKQLKLQKNE